jgi:hypothetical protein
MRSIRSYVLSVFVVCVCSAVPTVAHAEALAPWWGVTVGARPTQLPPGGSGQLVLLAENRGDTPTSGLVTLEDVVPANLEVVGIKARAGENASTNRGPVACTHTSKSVKCTFGSYEVTNEKGEKEVVAQSLQAYEAIEVQITVNVEGEADGEANSGVVVGGGAPRSASASRPIVLGTSEKFGFEDFQLVPEEAGGTIDTQAGSHPFQLTNVVTLNQRPVNAKGVPFAVALPKNIGAELPPGLVGNPTPFARCTDKQFATEPNIEADAIINECPAQAAIGVATVAFTEPDGSSSVASAPIFNMTPLPGEPARFGFKVLGIASAFLDTSVRTGSDYGVTVTANNITELTSLLGVDLTFWGVPGDPRHDAQRGWECLDKFGTCPSSTATAPPPFLIMPTSCEAPFASTLHGEAWPAGGGLAPVPAEPVSYKLPESVDGCNHLPFAPTIGIAPDVPDGSTATGLSVKVRVPQEAELNPSGLAESTLKNTTVVLPQGVALNPAGADGLQACSEAEIGFTGVEPASGTDLFTSNIGEPFCPDASKVGTVKIKTPLLPNPLEGAVYLADQGANPFGSLIAMYIVAEDPVSGTLVKLPGEVRPDPLTGQIVSTFQNTPELPFEELELHFFGGERAPLATPAHCGTYTTQASFAPWSGGEVVHPTSDFQITSAPNGSACPGAALPFSPSLTAGTTSIQAGGLSPFTMTMSREDGQQSLQAISLHMPPGLSGLLTGVKLCGEAQANAGTCGPESEIGETTVSVGLGGDPFSVKGGKVFITGGYEGAPYGLSIVNPAKAGPFDLENTPTNHPACDCLVVRAKIEVDPVTAQLTITSDNSGPYKIPSIIEGIPLQIKHVNVTINRPSFTFNPTNCNPMQITGSLSSTEGATSALSVPLQVTNCAILGFKPGFKVSTGAKTSRKTGASLNVKLTYPKAPFGSQANIKSVKVDLPKQLPSRLSTLQKACTSAQFQANPAGCPAASIVGHATAITPLIPVPLTGPAYFVSYGGAKFPELVVVLQGYGVTLDLHGETFISKAGITSSTFHTVPDAPVGSFELNLPQGQFSALAANANLCTVKGGLKMPTQFVAQNGATIKQSTPIAVTGCAKHVAKKKGKKTTHNRKRAKKK